MGAPKLKSIMLPDAPPVADRVAAGELDAGDDYNLYPSPSRPMDVARRIIDEKLTVGSHITVHYWREEWWVHDGKAWKQEKEDEIRRPLWDRLQEVTYKKGENEADWSPTPSKINNLMEPMRLETGLPDDLDAPFWIDGSGDQPASHMISMRNGLLNLYTRELTPHSPNLFTTWSLPFDYEPGAATPEWTWFMEDTFAHDPNGALLVQEMFGYILSGRTDLQKALMLIGPSSGGKGVILRTLCKIVGEENSTPTQLHNFDSEFGLKSLIGKPLAVIFDLRESDNRGSNKGLERLLNIIGGDPVSINRKGQDYWEGTLPTRLCIASNQVPRFMDSSGAINRRFMMARLFNSHVNNPDNELEDRIAKELPGIFLWALDGLARLEKQGRFTRPETMEELDGVMRDLAAPIQQFLDERYIVTGDEKDYVRLKDVHREHRLWTIENGSSAVRQGTLIQRLQAADPRVISKNTSVDGNPKERLLFGLRLKSS